MAELSSLPLSRACVVSLVACCLIVAVQASSLTPPPVIGSSAVRHLEPVRDFRVVHADMHLASPNVRTVDGHLRPMPDQVTVEFSVYGEQHTYELDIVSVFEPHSTMSLVRENDVVEELPWTITSYRKIFDNGNWVVATLRDDGTMHAAINQGGELLVIDPLSVHQREMHPANFHQLSAAAADHGMVAFRTQDQILDGNNTHLCGDVARTADEEPTPRVRNFTAGLRGPARRLLTVAPWTDCRTPFIALKFQTGVAADYGFYKAAGNSAAAVSSYIAQLFTTMNTVYLQQLNIFLNVQASIIMSVGGTATYPWNRDRLTAACPSISTQLTTLANWRASVKPTQQGVWHQLTDCYPPPGTVGLAYVGALCSTNYGAGISSYSSTMWLTTAHELGHNFGAEHTFQNGQGTTGGIMDYGDGKINGEYQFSSTYSKPLMCAQIVKALSPTARTGMVPYASCWESYAPTCGNGVVEAGEQCDDGGAGSACCTSTCTWTAGSQCSASAGECCLNCKYQPSSATCRSGQGYCANGACTTAFCSTYGLAYCGTQPTNACKQRCVINGVCNTMAGYTDSATGQPLPVGIANGVKCGNLSTSLCANAACSGA